ncbi:OLC1v1005283C1 [Oldenlandia corymbosa var. corymbosa]|uniref:OLC1v1005283C1 n=1 Tax=Oldenlandia corymbosa var. corymbosa TaxID=529605 RepID=A0AAV1DH03_OLDCO|nr:OLC1v1005283C1 [Oldenlandia corymbosa var. corymbosa]
MPTTVNEESELEAGDKTHASTAVEADEVPENQTKERNIGKKITVNPMAKFDYNHKVDIPAHLNEENDSVILDLNDGEVVTLELSDWNVDALSLNDSVDDVCAKRNCNSSNLDVISIVMREVPLNEIDYVPLNDVCVDMMILVSKDSENLSLRLDKTVMVLLESELESVVDAMVVHFGQCSKMLNRESSLNVVYDRWWKIELVIKKTSRGVDVLLITATYTLFLMMAGNYYYLSMPSIACKRTPKYVWNDMLKRGNFRGMSENQEVVKLLDDVGSLLAFCIPAAFLSKLLKAKPNGNSSFRVNFIKENDSAFHMNFGWKIAWFIFEVVLDWHDLAEPVEGYGLDITVTEIDLFGGDLYVIISSVFKKIIKNLYPWSEVITGTHGKLLHKSSDWIKGYYSNAGVECPIVLPKEQYGGLNLGVLILGNRVKHQYQCSLVVSVYVLPVGGVFIRHEVLFEGCLFGNFLFGLSDYNSIWHTVILYDEFISVEDHVNCGSSEDKKSLSQDIEGCVIKWNYFMNSIEAENETVKHDMMKFIF